MERHAECSCGQLQVVCVGEPVRVSVCHCLACQRRTGSVFAAQARFPHDRVAISGRSTAYVRVADSGHSLTFHFCPDCGATVYYQQDHIPDVIAVPLGAFADPGFPSPRFSIHERRKHPWVVMPGEGMEHQE